MLSDEIQLAVLELPKKSNNLNRDYFLAWLLYFPPAAEIVHKFREHGLNSLSLYANTSARYCLESVRIIDGIGIPGQFERYITLLVRELEPSLVPHLHLRELAGSEDDSGEYQLPLFEISIRAITDSG